ncbi:deleted in lung and esophageal cancer protein 1 [Clarias gariepinus]|uniref:deleted in lung and esophageal cancer protein 1 n=1 Tax=Clarias gariepinus TaxID=13013 RepID=UPI00234C1B8E|nr:deleted in lung and esophageal cancer protein 1 [Clarias gariepinus]
MQEEAGKKYENGIEPSMNRPTPASEKTQDISHVLASIFKDLYTTEVIGKDTVASLTKSNRKGEDHHSKYVEALQQVHLEYDRRIQDAEMLEKHIIQARQKASDKEEHVQSQLMEDVGEAYHQLGLPPVKSTFKWCVDNSLLKSHNLICPEDYIREQTPHAKAPPRKSAHRFAQSTASYSMHVSTQLQDDGYTLIPEPVTAQSLLEESEETLTLPSSQETFSIRSDSSQVRQVQAKKLCKGKPSSEDDAAWQKLQKCQNFLRSPHFQPLSHRRGGKSLIVQVEKGEKGKKESSSPEELVPVFIANPPEVLFTEYQIGDVYETTVELRNMTAASRHVRVIPPTTPHFSIGLGKFPGEGGIVAPGMSCQYTVRFAPDSLADFEDFLVVESLSVHPLIIPLEAHRPPPVLTLPAVLDLGYCLVGGVKTMKVVCHNVGYSAGTFCIMPKGQWPTSNLRSAVKACFAEEPPFAISPSLFNLFPGQAEVIQVVFFPTTAETFTKSFTIVCDNCQVKDFSIQGTGQVVMLELVALEGGEDLPALGELRDLTADHFIRFDSTNVQSVLRKKVMIKNNTHLELPFQWQIMKPNLQYLLPGEIPDPSCVQHHTATDNAFSINPQTGLFAPAQESVFILTFCPEELRDYHSVCHLVIMNVPNLQNSHASQQHQDPVGDVIVMEFEVKGCTEPYRILLEPYALLIPGESYIHTTIRKGFKMWNQSKSSIRFQWERINDLHCIEVEPLSGQIETNECLDMDLVLTGGRPGCLTTKLHCHIQHHSDPIVLPIEATFKGPDVSVNLPSVDLGIVQLGKEVCSTLQISNSSPLEAQWSLKELPNDLAVNVASVIIEPSQGVLAPLSSCSVSVIFRAMCCQSFESVLRLAVLNGTGCHLPVRAEVLCPQVCLLSTQMVLPILYVGIPQTGKATLFNQTLLPAQFTWNKLQGHQAHLCSASFTPSSGTLLPNAYLDISVSFTTHTDEELNDVTAVCEVDGMEKLLVLNFCCKAKSLSVSYSLPQTSTNCAASEVPDERPVVLDFTEDSPIMIGKSTDRQLLITNRTAISTSFIIEVEVFSEHRPKERVTEPSKHGSRHMKSLLHIMHLEKIEEKEHKDFVQGLLAHGKGVSFLVEPKKGKLGPFETVVINITAHSNMWGDYEDHLICKVGDLEADLIPMRMSVKGCPLYFQIIGPQPENQNQGPIIRFGTHISGGDTVSRSLRLNNPSPYDIRVDWLTYNKEAEDRKLIDLIVAYGEAFPLKDVDGNEVIGGPNSHMALLPRLNQCQTPSTEESNSSLRTTSETSDFDEELSEEEEQQALVSLASARKLFSVFIQPHEGCVSDYPYCITPQQIIVPAGGSSTIHVSFTPLTLSDPAGSHACVGYALGFMSLDSKMEPSIVGKVARAQGYELEPLRLDMLAFIKPAILTVQMEEVDEDVLQFSATASDLLDGHNLKKECVTVRTLQLINSTDVPLSFTLATQWPFSVLQRTHTHRAKLAGQVERQHTLLLPPKHNMQVKVAFHLAASLLFYQSQLSPEAPPTVTLLCAQMEERRLRFQENLTIQYSNSSLQSVGLCAHVALPMLHLSSNSVDFGTCYVGQTRVKEVFLSNHGGSSSFWTVLLGGGAKEENKVFKVAPVHGVLKAPEFPVSSSRQSLEISFTPSDQQSFQTTVTVQGILGEPCLTLQIQGRGSLDEKYISPTHDI